MDCETSASDVDRPSFANTTNIDTPTDKLADELKKWISDYKIKHNAADALLKILRDQGHKNLPSTSKTLLKLFLLEAKWCLE